MTNQELLECLDIKYKFWTCPKGCRGAVKWHKDKATRQKCGLTNK